MVLPRIPETSDKEFITRKPVSKLLSRYRNSESIFDTLIREYDDKDIVKSKPLSRRNSLGIILQHHKDTVHNKTASKYQAMYDQFALSNQSACIGNAFSKMKN